MQNDASGIKSGISVRHSEGPNPNTNPNPNLNLNLCGPSL